MATPSRRCSDRRSTEAGYALMSVLLAMLILGVLAAIVLGGTSGTPRSTVIPTGRTALHACITDVGAVEEAANSYLNANLHEPPSGKGWATASTHGGPYLDRWPSFPRYFRISWTGDSVAVMPRHGIGASGSAGTMRPPTGCYAI